MRARRTNYSRLVEERFGPEFRKIGVFAGEDMSGVRDERDDMTCPGCGMMPVEGSCGCGDPTVSAEPVVCPGCSMMPIDGSCGCSKDTCEVCGMKGDGCGHTVGEVAPPGKEKMVKALKKRKDIDNPWAVAWAAHNKQK